MDGLKISAILCTIIGAIGTIGTRTASGVHEMNVLGVMSAFGLIAFILWICVAVRAERRRKSAAGSSKDEAAN